MFDFMTIFLKNKSKCQFTKFFKYFTHFEEQSFQNHLIISQDYNYDKYIVYHCSLFD